MSLVVTMLISITACGDTTPASTTPVESDGEVSPTSTTDETNTPDEVDESIVEDGIVDEGTLGETTNEDSNGNATSGINTWNTDIENGIRWEYGDAAWLETYPLVEDPTLARNLTYFVRPDGNAISITWVAPNGVGEWYDLSTNGKTLVISDIDNNYTLRMWHGGILSDESDLMKNTNLDTILGFWKSGTVIADTYEVVEDSETSYRVLFEVTVDVYDTSYRGYAYFIDYLDRMECYQFAYLMEESLFNEEEAMMVINSIEYFEGLVLNKYDNN